MASIHVDRSDSENTKVDQVKCDGMDAGDEGWLAFRGYLHSIIRSRTDGGSRLDHSGIVQQTFLEAHQQQVAGKAPDDPRHLRHWLRQILVNNLNDAIRNSRRDMRDIRRQVPLQNQDLIAELSSPSTHFIRGEQSRKIMAAIAKLPEANQQVIQMRFFEGRSTEVIAKLLGRTEGAIASLLYRSVLKLKESLSKEARE